jgi:diacylglycerol kinase (ATP)
MWSGGSDGALAAVSSRRSGDASGGASRDLTVIVNGRASGVTDPATIGARATAALRRAGARDVTVVVTRDERELEEVVTAAGDRRVVLVGGDGAIHAFANLAGPLPEVGLLPAGRANNVARALGIPIGWEHAAAVAVSAGARRVDALQVQTPRRTIVAVEGVSAGFHAAARHRYSADNSAALGEGLQALAAELRRFHPYDAGIALDGTAWHDGDLAQVFFANLPLFGFGFRVDPMACADDGLLEAVLLRARTRTGVTRLIADARRGAHVQRRAVTWASAAQARIATPLPLVADAEPLGVTTADVRVLPGLLRIAVAPGVSTVLGELPSEIAA